MEEVKTVGTINNAVRRDTGDRTYYFGTIQSDKVKHVTFVPVLENSPKTPLIENTQDGYQRPGTLARMNKFKNFLKDNPDSLIPPVLLSGRGKWVFTPGDSGSPLGALTLTGSAAILDGQHRLGGFVLLYENDKDVRDIDFLLLENLELGDEVREFVTVNNTQVGVPKSLNYFLAQDVEGLGGLVGNIEDDIWIAWQLNVREDSPFLGRITRIKMGPEHLFQLHSVAKNIKTLFKDGAFNDDVPREEKLDITIRYWNLIADMHPTQWADTEKLGVPKQGRKAFESKLLELTGFIAWSLIGSSRILSPCYNSTSHTVDWDHVQQMIEDLAEKVDWRKDGQYANATGEVGGNIIHKDMQKILSQNPT
jgi:DNA sulfur modification protein DndB